MAAVLLGLFTAETIAQPWLAAPRTFAIPTAEAAGIAHSNSGQPVDLSSPEQLSAALAAIEADTSISSDFSIPRNDPSLDQDPFFLRAQSWTETDSDDSGFVRDSKGFSLVLPGAGIAWRLSAPLHPVFLTDRYLVLTANRGSGLFENKFRGMEGPSEGIFLVAYNEILAAAVERERVPVYFLPMPGRGWTEGNDRDVEVSEIVHRDVIVFGSTAGESVAMPLADIGTVIRAETMNFTLAMGLTYDGLFAQMKQRSGSEDFQNATVALDDLDRAMKLMQTGNQGAPLAAKGAVTEAYARFVSSVGKMLNQKSIVLARGSTAGFGTLFAGYDFDRPEMPGYFTSSGMSPARGGSVFAALISVLSSAASSVAHAGVESPWPKFFHRTTVLLAKISVIFIASVVLKHTVYKNRLNDVGKTNAYFTVMAHSLTFLMQAPSVWAPTLLEFVMDKIGVAENGWVRKSFDWSFGMVRKSNSGTPVNARTFALGFGVLGVADSLLVIPQTYVLAPWINKGLASVFGDRFPGFRDTVEKAYAADNASTANYNLINVISNFVGYLLAGAYGMSLTVQEKATNDALREVRAQMLADGKNPDSPSSRNEFESRVKARVRDELKLQGLPDESELLFDAMGSVRKVETILGYKAPDGANTNDFKGVIRPGRVIPAFKKALKRLEKMQADGSADAVAALQIMKDLKKRLNAKDSWKDSRRELVAITDGSIREETKFLPDRWQAMSTDGAKLAATIYRDEFFGLLGQTKTEVAQVAKSDAFDPLKSEGAFARWQLKTAQRRANERFVADYHMDLHGALDAGFADSPRLTGEWQRLFREELLAKSGLYPDVQDAAFITAVDNETEENFKARLNSDKPLVEYLAKLEPADKVRVETTIKSDLFARNYAQMAINKEMVPALSPSQPGRFQRLRQTNFVRESKVLTRILRFGEGLFTDGRYERGLWAKIGRDVVPLAEDILQGNIRMIRKAPVVMTASYVWNWALWQSVLPPSQQLFNFLLTGTTIIGPWATTQRIVNKLGGKPAKNIKSMIGFGIVGSFATFTGMIFYPILEPSWSQMVGSVTAHAGEIKTMVVTACEALLMRRP